MTCTCRFLVATTVTLSLSSTTLAGDAERQGMYPTVIVLSFFTAEMRAELKITPDQQRSLEGADDRRQAIWRQHCEEERKVLNSNFPEREKNAKVRALDVQVVNNLFKLYGETLSPAQIKRMKQISLQMRGMELFEYAEIRSALKIGDKEVKELRAAWNEWSHERMVQLSADMDSKKITVQEAARLTNSDARSVPRKVRELLSTEQRKILEDLLGEKFFYKK